MPTITTSTLPPAVQASFDQTLLSTPTRNFIYNVAAQRRKKTANSGDVVRYMRFNQLDSALVPLTIKLAELKSSLIDLEAEVVFN